MLWRLLGLWAILMGKLVLVLVWVLVLMLMLVLVLVLSRLHVLRQGRAHRRRVLVVSEIGMLPCGELPLLRRMSGELSNIDRMAQLREALRVAERRRRMERRGRRALSPTCKSEPRHLAFFIQRRKLAQRRLFSTVSCEWIERPRVTGSR